MDDDFYRPPDADPRTENDLPERPVLGIVAGVLIDLGGTQVIALLGGAVAMALTSGGDMAMTRLDGSAVSLLSLLGGLQALGGLAMSFAGGYFCVRISRGRSLRYPLIMAAIVVLVSLALSLDRLAMLLAVVLLSGLSFGATLLGATQALGRR